MFQQFSDMQIVNFGKDNLTCMILCFKQFIIETLLTKDK